MPSAVTYSFVSDPGAIFTCTCSFEVASSVVATGTISANEVYGVNLSLLGNIEGGVELTYGTPSVEGQTDVDPTTGDLIGTGGLAVMANPTGATVPISSETAWVRAGGGLYPFGVLDVGLLPDDQYNWRVTGHWSNTAGPGPAPKAEIDVNDTSSPSNRIALYNPPGSAEPYTQTIPAKITNLTSTAATFQLSTSSTGSGAVSLSQTSVTLAGGASTQISITPTADSSSPNDVQIIASQGGTQVGECSMTVVGVTIPMGIRNADTPAGMPDRIPPRVNTPVPVTITPDLVGSGQSVTLAVVGQNGSSGTVAVDGNPGGTGVPGGGLASITSSENLNLTGDDQTSPGTGGRYAGQLHLQVQVGGANTIQSNGFSVSAIPVNFSEALYDHGILFSADTHKKDALGIILTNNYQSDSGVYADLDQVYWIEQVEEQKPAAGIFDSPDLGSFIQTVPIQASSDTGGDTNDFPLAILENHRGGFEVYTQVWVFSDQRTGSAMQYYPIGGSGYVITDHVTPHGEDRWIVTVTKPGTHTTANDYTSDAGGGGASYEFIVHRRTSLRGRRIVWSYEITRSFPIQN